MNPGSTIEHAGSAFGHLGWNRQPEGGLMGVGTPPAKMILLRLALGSATGRPTAKPQCRGVLDC